MANLGRQGRFGSEGITSKGGKKPYGPAIPYTTPKFNSRTSSGRAPEGPVRTKGPGR